MTLSSNHQGTPCSHATHLSVMVTYQSPFGPWLVGVHFFGVDSNWRFPFFAIASCEQLPNSLAEFNII